MSKKKWRKVQFTRQGSVLSSHHWILLLWLLSYWIQLCLWQRVDSFMNALRAVTEERYWCSYNFLLNLLILLILHSNFFFFKQWFEPQETWQKVGEDIVACLSKGIRAWRNSTEMPILCKGVNNISILLEILVESIILGKHCFLVYSA